MSALFPATILASSLLLFLVQPIMAKQILPWFGGSASVWTACVFFFQLLLLLGYAYAHALVRYLSPRAQAIVHSLVLAGSAASLPILASPAWKSDEGDPSWRILLLLAATVGAPYFTLATTSPLIQAWYARTRDEPYRLFALSNAASLAGLLVYPALVETTLALRPQAYLWSACYVVFACLCALSAWTSLRGARTAAAKEIAPAAGPGADDGSALAWIALSALGSLALVSITAFIAQNVASVPLIWVAPLALYLVTFIIAFDGRRVVTGRALTIAALALCAAMLLLYRNEDFAEKYIFSLPLFLGGMFVACLWCHGALSARKPAPARLTYFYMIVSLGGALGSLGGGVLAPALLAGDFELPLTLAALGAFCAFLELGKGPRAMAVAGCAAMAFAGVAAWQIAAEIGGARLLARNFYSSLQVRDVDAGGPEARRRLVHGGIEHGSQYLDPARRREPISYYGRQSGAGLALARRREITGKPLDIGVIGLGAGALAAYGEAGGRVRYYEINPRVIDIAKSEFTYLADSAAETSTVLGDARLVLEREAPRNFDLLAIDAFSGDAIPMHLLTREALAIYHGHLAPGGVLAFHVTNKFVDLAPALAALARDAGLVARLVEFEPEDNDDFLSETDWVIIASDESFFATRPLSREAETIPTTGRETIWTDDFHNLLTAMRSPF